MFSIIIPLYNKEESIANTLKSILNQNYVDFEVIIVNDGSTDNSVDAINQFNDSRIKLIHKKNGGVASARNLGLLHARFEYIIFVDAGDTLTSKSLEITANVIDDNPKIDWFIFNYVRTYEGKSQVGNIYMKTKLLPKSKLRMKEYGNNCWAKVYRKSIIIKFKLIFPELSRGEDGVFNLSYILKIKDGLLWDKPVYNYIMDSTSVTMQKVLLSTLNVFNLADVLRFEIISNNDFEKKICDENKIAYIDKYWNVLRLLYVQKDEQLWSHWIFLNNDILNKYFPYHFILRIRKLVVAYYLMVFFRVLSIRRIFVIYKKLFGK